MAPALAATVPAWRRGWMHDECLATSCLPVAWLAVARRRLQLQQEAAAKRRHEATKLQLPGRRAVPLLTAYPLPGDRAARTTTAPSGAASRCTRRWACLRPPKSGVGGGRECPPGRRQQGAASRCRVAAAGFSLQHAGPGRSPFAAPCQLGSLHASGRWGEAAKQVAGAPTPEPAWSCHAANGGRARRSQRMVRRVVLARHDSSQQHNVGAAGLGAQRGSRVPTRHALRSPRRRSAPLATPWTSSTTATWWACATQKRRPRSWPATLRSRVGAAVRLHAHLRMLRSAGAAGHDGGQLVRALAGQGCWVTRSQQSVANGGWLIEADLAAKAVPAAVLVRQPAASGAPHRCAGHLPRLLQPTGRCGAC